MTLSEHPIDTPARAASPVHGFGTLAVHAGSPHDPATGAVIEAVCGQKRILETTAHPSRFHFQQRLRKPASESQSAHTTTQEPRIPTGTSTRPCLGSLKLISRQ
jgi:hypothetical protein